VHNECCLFVLCQFDVEPDGEDGSSVDAHKKTMKEQLSKVTPDVTVINDRMARTYRSRRLMITGGALIPDILEDYPALCSPSQVLQL